MTGLSGIGRNDDVVNSQFRQQVITVGTSEVLALSGMSALPNRQMLRIYNASNVVVYFGPSGVTTATGEPIEKKQWINIPAGDQVGIYLIAGSAGNSVIVSEWA